MASVRGDARALEIDLRNREKSVLVFAETDERPRAQTRSRDRG
jgi:hypothetical protein